MEKMKDGQFEHHFRTTKTRATGTSESGNHRSSSSVSAPVSTCQSPDRSSVFTAEDNGVVVAPRRNSTRKGTSFAYRIREHVRMGPKFSETVKGKLSMGAKIIKKGGRENLFREIFGVSDGEKLLKASQCYLSTTAGPIAGILFVSTEKVAFCSERSIAVHSPSQGIVRTPYKVCIPVKKIKGATEGENVNNPANKFIEVVTHDNFEFWFMGFVRYEKALVNLQRAISMSA